MASVSIDGGISWTRHEFLSSEKNNNIRAIAADPSDSDRIFCAGNDWNGYLIYLTEDGGANWTSNRMDGFSGIPQSLAVCPDDGNLLVCASSNALYASDDAGMNWYRLSSSFGGVNDLVSTNEYSFDEGLLIATADAGVWFWDWFGTPYQVFGAFEQLDITCVEDFGVDQHVFAGTDGSSAWRYYYGLGVEEGEGIETETCIFTISPNPATGSEVFAFVKLLSLQETNLSVFDISGRLVSIPLSGLLEAGEHSIALDVSSLSPGMYFARLHTGNTTASVKFLVVD